MNDQEGSRLQNTDSTDAQLELPIIEKTPEPGITVQVVAVNSFLATSILWVHNLLEKSGTNIPKYRGAPKPAGWGNGGGGVEPDELEKLQKRHPGHPILTHPGLSEEEKIIAACGFRELTDESGFDDVSIVTTPHGPGNQERVSLLEYRDPETGHRVITVWGVVHSFTKNPIREKEEVDLSEWFDIQISLPKLFSNQKATPGLPYWTHVRRTVILISKMDQYYREIGEPRECIGRLIHPSWRSVFRVGRRDKRFPIGGYLIPPRQWYSLMHYLILEKMEMADNDLIYELCERDVDQKRDEEARMLEEEDNAEATSVDTEGSEDRTGIKAAEEMVRQEDKEYRIWWERVSSERT